MGACNGRGLNRGVVSMDQVGSAKWLHPETETNVQKTRNIQNLTNKINLKKKKRFFGANIKTHYAVTNYIALQRVHTKTKKKNNYCAK